MFLAATPKIWPRACGRFWEDAESIHVKHPTYRKIWILEISLEFFLVVLTFILFFKGFTICYVRFKEVYYALGALYVFITFGGILPFSPP